MSVLSKISVTTLIWSLVMSMPYAGGQVRLLWFTFPDLVSCGILQKPQRLASALDR